MFVSSLRPLICALTSGVGLEELTWSLVYTVMAASSTTNFASTYLCRSRLLESQRLFFFIDCVPLLFHNADDIFCLLFPNGLPKAETLTFFIRGLSEVVIFFAPASSCSILLPAEAALISFPNICSPEEYLEYRSGGFEYDNTSFFNSKI